VVDDRGYAQKFKNLARLRLRPQKPETRMRREH
jgi:hypothetical protein